MKIALFGASGNLGRPLVEKALARGHSVIALLRTPAKAELPRSCALIAGDVRDAAAVAKALSGQDAVINAVGGEGDIRPVALSNILSAMRQAKLRRLINLGGAGILELGPWPLYRLPIFPKAMVPVTLEHLKVFEQLRASDLDWTMVCPPFMAPDASSGGYRVKSDHPFLSSPKAVPLADVADFILDELETPRFIGRRVGIRRK